MHAKWSLGAETVQYVTAIKKLRVKKKQKVLDFRAKRKETNSQHLKLV